MPSETQTVPDNTDTIVTAVTTIEAAQQEILDLQKQLHEATTRLSVVQESRTAWENKYWTARNDWNTLNDHLKDYANENSMCSSFEDKLEEWNEDYKLLKLEGRVREYNVSVTVTATYYATVTVEAKSPDDAEKIVNNMDSDDIDNNSDMSWRYPDDAEFETGDVEEA